ncbi:MAG: hypothetical protein K2N93_03585 [Alistipes sp.]|nr:hypothetical protein [Alistipes sp.]
MLYASYYCACTLFVHTHHFSWGTVTHSHPLLPSSEGHGHTPIECQTIAALSSIVATEATGFGAAPTLLLVLTAVLITPPVHSLARHIRCNRTLRAPPLFIR